MKLLMRIKKKKVYSSVKQNRKVRPRRRQEEMKPASTHTYIYSTLRLLDGSFTHAYKFFFLFFGCRFPLSHFPSRIWNSWPGNQSVEDEEEGTAWFRQRACASFNRTTLISCSDFSQPIIYIWIDMFVIICLTISRLFNDPKNIFFFPSKCIIIYSWNGCYSSKS